MALMTSVKQIWPVSMMIAFYRGYFLINVKQAQK